LVEVDLFHFNCFICILVFNFIFELLQLHLPLLQQLLCLICS
jgi:hypothetical protein